MSVDFIVVVQKFFHLGRFLKQWNHTFIRDQSIGEHIHLAQELLQKYARKRISPRCMIKVDLRKAFDMVDWDFLMAALVSYDFLQQFRD